MKGTILTITGTNFFASEDEPFITIEVLIGTLGFYTVVGTCFVFDPEFDIARNRIFAGSPALLQGLYHLRVTTEGGVSNVLEDVLAARLFAEEYKTLSVRGKFGPKWRTGPRLLRG